jgi:hypothetical protein
MLWAMEGLGSARLAGRLVVCSLAWERVGIWVAGPQRAPIERTCCPKGRWLSMNLRHAAALALVGWYMLIPPTSRDYPMGNVNAPLTEWVRRPTIYRNKEECEHVLDRQTRLRNAQNRQTQVRFRRQWQCVASDDPRLAK